MNNYLLENLSNILTNINLFMIILFIIYDYIIIFYFILNL